MHHVGTDLTKSAQQDSPLILMAVCSDWLYFTPAWYRLKYGRLQGTSGMFFLSSRFITKAGYIYQIFASGYWYMKDIRHIKSIFAYTKKTAITTTIILTTCTIILTTRYHHLNCITDFRTDSTCRAYKYQYYTEVQIQAMVFYLFFITWFVMHYFSSVHCTQYIM